MHGFTNVNNACIIRPSRPDGDYGGTIMQVNIYEAKTHFAKLVNSLGSEKEIIIAKRGVPVAKLIPYSGSGKRQLCTAEGRFDIPDTAEEFDNCNDLIADMFGV